MIEHSLTKRIKDSVREASLADFSIWKLTKQESAGRPVRSLKFQQFRFYFLIHYEIYEKI